jgi:hypothetical protein
VGSAVVVGGVPVEVTFGTLVSLPAQPLTAKIHRSSTVTRARIGDMRSISDQQYAWNIADRTAVVSRSMYRPEDAGRPQFLWSLILVDPVT